MRFLLALALIAAALAACAPSHRGAEMRAAHDPVARGRILAQSHCSGCHAVGPRGESPHPAAPPLRTLSQRYEVDALAEAFAEGVLVGHPDMPEFRFAPAQIEDLLDYIESVQTRGAG